MSVQELQESLMVLGSSGIVVFAHQSLESLGRMVVSADILGGCIHTVAHSDKTDDGEIRRLTVVERIWIALAIVPLMMSLRHIAIWLQHWIGVEDASRKDRMDLDDSILMVVDAAIAVANDGRHVDLAEIVIECSLIDELDELQAKLEKFLLETVSFHDAASESFYHGLILGLCAMLDDRYQITSNRESGEGRFDIQMAPLSEKLPGVLIELKSGKDCTEAQLESLSKTALQQINDRMYSTALKQQGVPSILKYGIAFSGKKVSIAAEIEKK